MDAQLGHYLSNYLIAVSLGVAAGVVGFVYAVILTEPDHILGPWKRWVVNSVHELFARIYKDDLEAFNAAEYVLKPIVSCELCVSGQLALWTYIFTQQFNLLALIFCVCLSILTAKILATTLTKK